jgi:hypothetical protein
MPRVNFTIDNINPLISYLPVGSWSEGTPSNDPLAGNYSNGGTFTLTTTLAAHANFNFNGSAIWVFGAKRGNHGPYSVQLDGTTQLFDGFAPDPGLFQTPLFSSADLTQGSHSLVITDMQNDTSRPYIDIDFITWETEIGTDGDVISTSVIQDSDPSFSYSPSTSWTTDITGLTGFNDSNGHVTFEDSAFATFAFTGDAVALYGAVGPTSSAYTVQLDGGGPLSFNATKQAYYPQVMLYSAVNLGSGQHMVTLVNNPTAFGQGLLIDYAVVSNVPSVPNTGASSTISSSTTSPSTSATATTTSVPSGSRGLKSGLPKRAVPVIWLSFAIFAQSLI